MAETTQEPLGKVEQMLVDMINGEPIVEAPDDKIQGLLMELAQVIAEGGGGGGGGTTNYNSLTNKPKINGTELSGNKTTAQLGLQSLLNWDNAPTSGSSNAVRSSGIFNALAEKVTAEAGKGLSSNDFTNALLTKLNGIEASADVNVIEKVLVNGTEVVPVNKAVELTVMTNTVNNLANYYLKSETYTQSEVDELISHISGGITLEVVEALPTSGISTTTIYLLAAGENVYTQYLWSTKDSTWKILGSTTVDLSNYYTKAQIDALLAAKQDTLTFDSAPTSLSENPVTSGGVYSALASKQDALTFDNAPTEDSANPVKSGGVYSALEGKQDTLTFDTEPIAGSTNPVTSGGVASALQNVDVPVATEERAGKVKPDGTTVTIEEDGTIHAAAGVDFDERDFVEDSGTVALVDSQRIFTGTQAEWDALSTAIKKTYGQVNITDDESGTPEYYSTTETKTNKVWIDGKDIYRRVIYYWWNGAIVPSVNHSNSIYSGDAVPEDILDLVDAYMVSYRSTGDVDVIKSNGVNGGQGAFVPNISNRTAYFGNGGYNPTKAYAVFEYTKEG